MPENANASGETSAIGDAGGKVYSIDDLARRVGGRIASADTQGSSAQADPALTQDASIAGLAPLDSAGPHQLSHLSSAAFTAALETTQAGAVLLRDADVARCPCTAIVVDNPYWAYAHLSSLFEQPQEISGLAAADRQAPEPPSEAPAIAQGASVAADVQCGNGVRIGAGARVGAASTLGDAVVIHANAVIGAKVTLAEGVTIHPGAVVADGVRVGAHSTIHANAVVGGEGFGYAPDHTGVLERIAQLGAVVIGQNVSIGAGSTVDRGALGDTWIGDGVKIDNQVQIGHNCHIGNHSVICGCCGIVGSTTIGKHCVLGGGVGVGGDGPITLCDGVTVSGMTHVSRSIDTPGVYSGGVLHSESSRWKRNALRFADLDRLAKRLTRLEKRLPDEDA